MFRKKIKIDNQIIEENSLTYVIAEAGVNHNGKLDIAKKLVRVACKAGVNAIKFQAFKVRNLLVKNTRKAPYQIRNIKNSNKYQNKMLNDLELSKEENIKLFDYCKKNKITFITTPYDVESLNEVVKLGVNTLKIASTDLTNLFFLKELAMTKLNLILSTGMSSIKEIDQAVNQIKKYNSKLIILQCTSNYPVANKEAGIFLINEFKKRYGCNAGYSDHTSGVGAGPYAVAAGAKVIEKHFTLNKNMRGPDHKASINPKELKIFVEEIKKVDEYMKLKSKIITRSELRTKKFLQKYIVASKEINKGKLFNKANITTKRTAGKGIPAINFYKVLNKKSKKNFNKDEIIKI